MTRQDLRSRTWHLAIVLSLALVVAACGDGGGSSTTEAPDTSDTSAAEEPTASSTSAPEADQDDTPEELEEASLRLSWIMTGYSAPWQYGVDEGLFRDVGIDLTVGEGEGSATSAQVIASGGDDFGFVDIGAILPLIEQGMPLTVVGVFQQQGAVSFIHSSEVNIGPNLEGLQDRVIIHAATGNTYPLFLGLLESTDSGLTENDLNTVAVSSSAYAQTFLNEYPDGILLGSANSTYQVIKEEVEDVQATPFADYGVNVFGFGVVVHNDTLESNPDLVRRFLEAAVKAWEASAANPADAVAAAAASYPDLEEEAALSQLNATLDLMFTEATAGGQPGRTAEEDWDVTLAVLAESTDMSGTMEPSDFYTNEYLPPE